MADETGEESGRATEEAAAALGKVADRVGGARVMGEALTALIGSEVRRTVGSSSVASTKATPKPSDEPKPRKPTESEKAIWEALSRSKDPTVREYGKDRSAGVIPGPVARPKLPDIPSPTKPRKPEAGLPTPPSDPVARPKLPDLPSHPSLGSPAGSTHPGENHKCPCPDLEQLRLAAERAASALDKIQATTGGGGSGVEDALGSVGKEKHKGKGGKWDKIKEKLGNTKFGRKVKGVGRMIRIGSKVGKPAGRGLAGAMGGGKTSMGRAGFAAGGAAGAAAGVATAVVAVGVALYHLERQIAEVSESALRSAERYKEASAAMGQVFQEKEFKDFQRNATHGESTAGSTQKLMEADARRKDQEDRISVVYENAMNKALTKVNEILIPVVEGIAGFVEDIADFFGIEKRKNDEATGLAAVVPDMIALANALRRDGEDLMDIARRAADRARGGVIAPGGAAPIGRGPL